MKLTFAPMRHSEPLQLDRQGDVLTVNGESFDFSALPDGAALPAQAIDSPWFAGDVLRQGGSLHIPLILPHAADAPEATRFPAEITLVADGPVDVPPYGEEEPE